MALNKRFNDIQKLYDKLGWDNAETLKDAMGKSPDYMYIAFLTQTGTDAPVGNVLYNDLVFASPVYFSYEGTGTYRMYCNLFKPGYMEVEIHDGQGSTFVDSTITATVYTGYVELKVFTFGLSDNILQNTPIKIRVWSNAGVEEASVAPTPFGYRYAIVNDTTCSAFSIGACDWTASGGLLSTASNWGMEMAAFYPDGNAIIIDNYYEPSCTLLASSYFLKTIGNVDPGVMTLTDANCNPAPGITWNLITGSLKNYSGTIPTGPVGSNSWRTVTLPGDSIGLDGIIVDISDPTVLAVLLQNYFQAINNPTCTVTATDLGGGTWQIDVNQIYSNTIVIELEAFLSIGTYSLNLVP